MNVALWLERTARLSPQRPALYSGSRQIADYAAFHDRVRRLAGGLRRKYQVEPGDRVGLFMTNTPGYLVLMYAIWQAGGVVVPINYKLHAKEAAFILTDSGARLVLADAGRSAALAEIGGLPPICEMGSGADDLLIGADLVATPVARGRDDLAWLFYTSGTTGRPKGVIITHGNIAAMTLTYFIDVDEVRADDVALYAAPMSHGAGLYNFMHVLRGAGHAVPDSGGFEPEEILDLAPRLASVHLFAAPTMVRRLVDVVRARGKTGEGIRTIVYGGGPMYVADIEEAVAVLGPRFIQIYGQGESPMTITALPRDLVADRSHPRWRERLGSVGFAQSCVEVAILDAAGQPCAVGETGEIAVRGAPVMPGYWNNPEASAKAIRDGWLWTGDVGRMDADGFVTLTDRSKDVIISGGTNIYPREVEEVLLELDGVAEVSVIGRAHPDWGEEVVACVVLAPGAALSVAELDAHCLANMARFKRPKDYHVLKALPKNSYGKVLKTDLRTRFDQA